MPLVPCPECSRQISHKAEACPGCGHPTPYEYCTVQTSVGWNEDSFDRGKEGLERLRKEGWEVVDESVEEDRFQNRHGEDCWADITTHKLRRSLRKAR